MVVTLRGYDSRVLNVQGSEGGLDRKGRNVSDDTVKVAVLCTLKMDYALFGRCRGPHHPPEDIFNRCFILEYAYCGITRLL